jgi:peroxiredoxin family protein
MLKGKSSNHLLNSNNVRLGNQLGRKHIEQKNSSKINKLYELKKRKKKKKIADTGLP